MKRVSIFLVFCYLISTVLGQQINPAQIRSSTAGAFLYGNGTGYVTGSACSSGQLFVSGGTGAYTCTTATFPSTAGSSGTVLRANGTNWVASTFTIPDTFAISTIPYASSANVLSALATANSSVLITNGSGVPSWSTTIPAVTLGGTISGGGNQINNVVIGTTTPLAGSFTTINQSGDYTQLQSSPIIVLKRSTSATDPYFRINITTSNDTLKWQLASNEQIGPGFEINEGITNRFYVAPGGAVSIPGTLSVTGHTTFEGVTSTGATGTGNLVYSASPTFTGTVGAAAITASGAVKAGSAVTVTYGVAFTGGGGRSVFASASDTYAVGVRYDNNNGDAQYWIGATNSATPDLVFSNNSGTEKFRLSNTGAATFAGGISATSGTFSDVLRSSSSIESTVGYGFWTNIYYDGNFRYRATNAGNIIDTTSGDFRFSTTPSGTAGSVASLTERLRIANTGLVTAANGLTMSAGSTGNATLYGSSDAAGSLSLISTSGTGSGDAVYVKGGANGGTTIASFFGAGTYAGNVGIGTTGPGSLLDIAKDANPVELSIRAHTTDDQYAQLTMSGRPLTATQTIARIRIRSTRGGQADTDVGYFDFEREGSAANNATALGIYTHDGSSVGIRMRITSGGNVGIGTTNPLRKLHVAGDYILTDNAKGLLGLDTSAAQKVIAQVRSDNSYGFGESGLVITTTGNVGIGTISPNNALSIGGGATRSTTQPTNGIDIFNGTAPAGTLTNGVTLYSASGELNVMDAAGNNTVLSPHNFSLIPGGASEPLAWAFYSTRDGHTINVDMLKLVRLVEKLSGEKLVFLGEVKQ